MKTKRIKNVSFQASAANSRGSEIPQHFSFMADCDFTAAEGDAKAPSINMVANTGKPMKLRGFYYPVIVAIDGAKFDKRVTPIIMDHDVSLRVGHTTAQNIDATNSLISAKGIVSSKSDAAKSFIADATDGFPFQVSIGADIIEGIEVPAGEKVSVNNKTWKGPLIVAQKTLIRELTVTVLGADKDTSAVITASLLQRNNAMDFESWCEDMGINASALTPAKLKKLKAQYASIQRIEAGEVEEEVETPPSPPKNRKRIAATANSRKKLLASVGGGVDEDDDNDEDAIQAFREKQVIEAERIERITEVAAEYSDSVSDMEFPGEGKKKLSFKAFKAHAMKSGMAASEFELALLRASRTLPPENGPGIHVPSKEIDAEAMQASILRYAGVPNNGTNKQNGKKYGLEAMFKPEVLEASHSRQYAINGSIQALMDLQIRAAGNIYAGVDRGSSEFVGAAVKAWDKIQASGFSTLNIVYIMESVLHKVALASFDAASGVWDQIAAVRSLNDFKTHNLYRLDLNGSFKQVGTDGELKHISMSDSKYTIAADTYGAMLTIDRKTIKNDDLGMVLDKARSIGTLGANRIEESVFVLLLSNPSSFFASGNNNLIVDVLGMAGLESARQKFRNQVVNGKPTNANPVLLLVGTTNETLANNLYQNERLGDYFSGNSSGLNRAFVNNEFKGLYRPVVSPYLNNTSITDQDGKAITGQSSTQWYLGADPSAPQGAAIQVGFIDGRRTPYIESADTQFNIPGGIQYRCYLDWGVAMHVTQMMVKSTGAGS